MINDTRAGGGAYRSSGKEAFWQRVLRDFGRSGLSVRAFCRARRVAEPSFYAWRRTLMRRDAAAGSALAAAAGSCPRSPTPAFVPVRVIEAPEDLAAAPVEIVLPDGYRLRLHPPIDTAALGPIVAALESVRRDASLTAAPAEV